MLKLVVTIADFGAAINLGADVERVSEIMDIPTNNIPPGLKGYLEDPKIRKYQTISISILEENI